MFPGYTLPKYKVLAFEWNGALEKAKRISCTNARCRGATTGSVSSVICERCDLVNYMQQMTKEEVRE